MVLLSKRTAEERIASLLLSLSARHKRRRLSDASFRLPMSRSDIGNYLGLAVETVSRIFTRFQQLGVLGVVGKEITILDRAHLCQLAEPAGELDQGQRHLTRLKRRRHQSMLDPPPSCTPR
jgi:CRP/FNR family transcriptional regulator